MDLYDAYLAATKKDTYTFGSLISYTDQILAVYQEELSTLKRFREAHINTAENSQMLKKEGYQIKQHAVNAAIITIPLVSGHPLGRVQMLAQKLHEREALINTNIREVTAILKRFQQLKERNP